MSVEWFGDSIIEQVRKAAMRGVIDGTESVLAEGTSLILSNEKSGRVYRRRGVEHRASAPGEAPASDTGRLVQSGRTEYHPDELAGEAIWSTDYAAPLEYGNERIEPRPYARPALANRKEAIEQRIGEEVSGALKG